MAYLIDCRGWLPGVSLVVLSAGEALTAIASLRAVGREVERVLTIDGAAVTLFELRLLASSNPILLP